MAGSWCCFEAPNSVPYSQCPHSPVLNGVCAGAVLSSMGLAGGWMDGKTDRFLHVDRLWLSTEQGAFWPSASGAKCSSSTPIRMQTHTRLLSGESTTRWFACIQIGPSISFTPGGSHYRNIRPHSNQSPTPLVQKKKKNVWKMATFFCVHHQGWFHKCSACE